MQRPISHGRLIQAADSSAHIFQIARDESNRAYVFPNPTMHGRAQLILPRSHQPNRLVCGSHIGPPKTKRIYLSIAILASKKLVMRLIGIPDSESGQAGNTM
jgi:hypothetical protein